MTFTNLHDLIDLFIATHGMLGETIDENSESLAFSDFEASLWSLLNLNHEILYLFVIYFTHHRRYLI